jgi:hypothetical protein
MTWRLGSTRYEGAAEGYDNKVIGGLRHLSISKTLMQSSSPVKTKYIKLVITKRQVANGLPSLVKTKRSRWS